MSGSAPSQCPSCASSGTLVLDSDAIICVLCGYRQRTAAPQPVPAPLRKLAPSYRITYKGALDPWARAAFDTGQDCVRREDWAGAAQAFRRALENQKDFIDAHFWLALISDDPVVKRDHLTTVLAYDPNNIEAIRELMVVDGRLTPEEASRTHHHEEIETRRADLPVNTQTTVLKCPVCEGDLTIDGDHVVCRFCGHKDQRPLYQRGAGSESLAMALIQRKAKAVRWVIGERLLHCNNCGAERTIPNSKLSLRCPFCASNHVIEQDALGSFEQPDALLPFRITREQAGALIKQKLRGWGERMRGWFDDNRVKRGTLEGYFLPFWVFDAVVEVTKTVSDTRSGQGRIGVVQPFSRTTIPEMVNNLPVCAVASPPARLTAQLGPYNLAGLVAYSADLLAQYPAELYTLDFDRASLEARSIIGKQMRAKHGQTQRDEVKINIFSGVRQMHFQLVLLPVWVANLLERDGDTRLALVNGQTGSVVLGKSQKNP